MSYLKLDNTTIRIMEKYVLSQNVTRTMEKYVLSQTRQYDYQNATQEQTKFAAAYRLSLLNTFFRRLVTNLDGYLQLQMSI